MRIALLGTRGIPAIYGGFETFAEELSTRLVKRGHRVTVYCRPTESGEKLAEYRGVELVHLPTIRHKYLDTLAHTGFSTAHLTFRRFDVALYCNAANAIYTLWPRLLGCPVALNVDGLERNRKKWNRFGKAWYALSERLSCRFPTEVVTDAKVIETYYRERYSKRSTFIAYGADFTKETTTDTLNQLGLERGRYFLYVSRLEPENNALLVAKAFAASNVPHKLALIGDAPYADEYIQAVRAINDPRIVMPGGVYGQGYRELQSHCLAYIHATEVGGTHPALVEAMGRGAPTLYLDTPENREVAGDAGLPFSAQEPDLTQKLEQLAATTPEELQRLGSEAEKLARSRYDWESITDRYEQLFAAMTNGSELA